MAQTLPQMSKGSPASAPRTARDAFMEDYARAPRLAGVQDLVEALGGGLRGRERLVDAYAQGWLGVEDARTMEQDQQRLLCWLLARLVRLSLGSAGG